MKSKTKTKVNTILVNEGAIASTENPSTFWSHQSPGVAYSGRYHILTHCCSSLQWRYVGLCPRLNHIIIISFLSLPAQLQGWHHRSKLRWKWLCEWTRWPRQLDPPTPLHGIDTGGSRAFQNALICRKWKKHLKIPLPLPWSWLADSKMCFGAA